MGKILKKIVIPALIVAATAFLVGVSGGTLAPIAFVAAAESAIITAAVIGLSLVASFLTKPSQNLNSVFSREQTRLDPSALGKWVFGKTNSALDLVFEDQSANRYVTQVLHNASHEINSYQELYINDAIAIDSAGVVQTPWLNIVKRFVNLGTASQLALVMPNSAWPATAKGQGFAHMGLEWDFKNGQDKISGGVPTRLTQVVQGCKVYDPRLDTTVGGVGLHRAADQTTWEYTNATVDIGENWALLVAFYLLGWKVNGKLVIGMGIDPADIDMAQLIEAANVCEQIVDTKKRYKIGGVLQTDGNHQQVLKELESAIGGKVSKIGGKWFIWAPFDDLTSLETITDADLVADIPQVFSPAGPLEQRFNGARGRFVNPALQFQPEFYPDVSEPAGVTEDGREHVKEQDFSMIQDVSIAERVARMMVRRSRFAGSFKYVFWFTAIRFQPFDVITINGRDTNNLNVLVRIINMTLSPSGIVIMEMVEENSSIYNTADPLGTPLTQQDPNAFDPTAQIPLTGLLATPITVTGTTGSMTDAFNVTWNTVGGLVKETEVQFTVSALVQWQLVPPANRDFDNAVISPVEPGTLYDIRARHITITDVVGEWVTIVNQLAGSDGTFGGLSIAELAIFKRAASAPATPTGGSYDFGLQSLTPPAGWSSAIPAGNDPIWNSRGVASIQGIAGIDSTITWSGPVQAIINGESVDIIFKRSATQPATPAPSPGVPVGWFTDVNSVPAGPDPIWSSVGTRANAGQNWTWQTPVKIEGQDGAPGLNQATVFIYQRTNSATPPAVPSVNKTYTFATGLLTSAAPWTQTIPAASPSLQFLWVTTAAAISSGTTDVIAPGEWASPVIQGQDGIQTTVVFIYKRTTTSTPPATPTTASATYTFATGVLSAVDNGWTNNIPATGGGFLWRSQATALATSIATTDSILAAEWSAAVLLAQDGAAGGGGSTLVKINTNGESAAALSPANATIAWRLNSTGNEEKAVNGGAFTTIAAWKLSGLASDYSVRAIQLGGTFLSGTFGTWLNLATTQSWSVTDTSTVNPPITGTMSVDIRLDSTGNIEVTKTFTLEAEKVI